MTDGGSARPHGRIWRSALFVPAHVERFVAKAPTVGADAIILDFEDSVPPEAKPAARNVPQAAVEAIRAAGADIVARINKPLDLAVEDARAAVALGCDAISVAKASDPGHVRLLDELLSRLEAQAGRPVGATAMWLVIEDSRAFADMAAIAAASRRVTTLSLGGEDFAADIGMAADEETLHWPHQALVVAAAQAGVNASGLLSTVSDFRDLEAFERIARRSRRFGFTGAACIHPSQVAVLNRAFSPTKDEIEAANEIVAAWQDALARGLGAVAVRGRMVDPPVVRRAERVLEMAERLG